MGFAIRHSSWQIIIKLLTIHMNPDYKKHYYDVVKMTINKRITIDKTLDKLHEMQLNMIDEAVGYSDLAEANDVIKMIKSKA